MTSDEKATEEIEGLVKWFDPAKGFGFIVSEDVETDILLHANALRNFGLSSVCDRARIRITVQMTPRGMQALDVLEVLPPDEEDADQPAAENPPVYAADKSILLEAARVKWFDKVKGFGFANVFGKPEDVFIHMETLRRSGLGELQPGEAIALRVSEGERGRMAVSIEPWESARQERPSTAGEAE